MIATATLSEEETDVVVQTLEGATAALHGEASQNRFRDQYHAARLQQYEFERAQRSKKRHEVDELIEGQIETAEEYVKECSSEVAGIEKELARATRSMEAFEKDFVKLLENLQEEDVDDINMPDIVNAYSDNVSRAQAYLGDKMTAACTQAENNVRSWLQDECERWVKGASDLWDKNMVTNNEEYNSRRMQILEEGRRKEDDLKSKIDKETDASRVQELTEELKEAKKNHSAELLKELTKINDHRKSISEKKQKDLEALTRITARLDALTTGWNPIEDDEPLSIAILETKQEFMMSVFDRNRWIKDLGAAKAKALEAEKALAVARRSNALRGSNDDGEQLQFKIMLAQIQEKSNTDEGQAVYASIKTEIEANLADLKKEKAGLDKALKDELTQVARTAKLAKKMTSNETSALTKKVTTLKSQAKTLDGQMSTANVFRKTTLSKDKVKVEDAITKTEEDIASLKEELAQKESQWELSIKASKDAHQQKSHRIDKSVAFWEGSLASLKEYGHEEPMDTEQSGEEDVNKLESSLGEVDLDAGATQEPDTGTLNEPALQNIVKFRADVIRDIWKLRENGNQRASSLKRKNKVIIGNVYYYTCDSIHDLYDVDDHTWTNVRHLNTAEIPKLPTGPGVRRTWSYKRDRVQYRKIQRIAFFYEQARLGVVRYHTTLDDAEVFPDLLSETALEELEHSRVEEDDDDPGEVVDSNANPLASLQRTDPPAQPKKATYHAQIAEPQISEKLLVLDAEVLYDIIREVEEADGGFLNPRADIIKDPKGGEIYIYEAGKDVEKDEKNIHDDGFRWKHNKNTNQGSLFLRRHYYTRVGRDSIDTRFCKYLYLSKDDKTITVHYVGEEEHGVAKVDRYSRSQSVRRIREAAEELGLQKVRPTDLLSDLKTNTTAEGVAKELTDPRSVAAVRWELLKQQGSMAQARDDLTNAIITAQATGGAYIREVGGYPQLRTVLLDSRVLDEVNTMLKHIPEDQVIELHYDTTFNMHDKYLSILSFRHPYIHRRLTDESYRNKGAIVPLVSQFHMTKATYDHKLFFFQAREMIRAQSKDFLDHRKVLITDGEFEDVASDWPNTEQALCWNHLRQNIINHAELNIKPKMSVEDLKLVDNDVYQLLTHKSLEAYKADLKKLLEGAHWNTPEGLKLKEYFLTYKDKRFRKYACRFALEEKGLVNVDNGITNNPAETLNSQLAYLKDKNYASGTALFLEMQRFESKLNLEINQAYYGVGAFTLDQDHAHLQKDPANLPSTYLPTTSEASQAIQELQCIQPTSHVEGAALRLSPLKGTSSKAPCSVQEQARFYVDNNRLKIIRSTDGRGNLWVVEGYADTYVVKLGENACSCGSRLFCGHLLAARYASGMQNDYTVPKGKTLSAVSRAKSIPTPGRRNPKYGSKKPTKALLTSESVNPPEAVRATAIHEGTPSVARYTPLEVSEMNEQFQMVAGDTPPPAKRPRGRPRTKDLRSVLFAKTPGEVIGQAGEVAAHRGLSGVSVLPDLPSGTTEAGTATGISGSHPTLVSTAIQRAVSRSRATTMSASSILDKVEDILVEEFDVLERQMKPGEVMRVADYDGNQVLATNIKPGHLIIFMDTEQSKNNWVLIESTIGMVSSQAVPATKTSARSYQVRVAMMSAEGSTKEELAEATANFKDVEFKQVSLTCLCIKPALEGNPNAMKCSNCQRSYHRDCVGNHSDFLCKPCSTEFQGMKWSHTGKYTNTCPADTLITPMIDHTLNDDFELLETMKDAKKMNPSDRAFLQACTTATEAPTTENFGLASDIFSARAAQLAKNTTNNNCFMGICELTHSMSSFTTFQRQQTCEGVGGQKCRTTRATTQYKSILLPADSGLPMYKLMEDALTDIRPTDAEKVCASCKRRAGPGEDPPTVMEGPLEVVDAKHPAPILIFETPGSVTMDEAFAAPNEVTVSGYKYSKKYIAYNRGNSHYMCHFKRDDLWISYDGMMGNRYHITTPMEKRQEANHLVEQIGYFRSSHPALAEAADGGTIAQRLELRRPKAVKQMQLLGTLTQEVERTDDNNLPLRVQETVDKGLGVFAVTDIPKGNFVLEYSGELITGPEAQSREVSYSQDQSVGCFLYYFKWRDTSYCVDASANSGRLGRLVNHSKKKANLQSRVFEHKGVPHILFFATTDIHSGEELLYDYGDRRPSAVNDFPWLSQ